MVWLAVTLLFWGLVLIEGNPVSLYLDPRLTPELRQRLKAEYGYDQIPARQYITYLNQLIHGEFGTSFIHKNKVSAVLASRAPRSLGLGAAAYVAGMMLSAALLIGLWQRRYPVIEKFARLIQSLCLTLPSFLFANLLVGLFAVKLGWFPILGSRDVFADDFWSLSGMVNLCRHVCLPVLSLALPIAGQFTAYLREQQKLLDSAPFVLSARGRGVSEWRIFLNHQLRSLWPAWIQLAGLYLPMVAGGALVIEAMFGWSGMGVVLFDAALARDYPLLLGGCIWTALFVIPCYELADRLRAAAKVSEGGS